MRHKKEDIFSGTRGRIGSAAGDRRAGHPLLFNLETPTQGEGDVSQDQLEV